MRHAEAPRDPQPGKYKVPTSHLVHASVSYLRNEKDPKSVPKYQSERV